MLTGGVSVWLRESMRERGDSPLKGTGLFIFPHPPPPLHDCCLSSEEKETECYASLKPRPQFPGNFVSSEDVQVFSVHD